MTVISGAHNLASHSWDRFHSALEIYASSVLVEMRVHVNVLPQRPDYETKTMGSSNIAIYMTMPAA